MSVKKLLVLTAASVVTTSVTIAMAGGPTQAAMPVEPDAFQNSLYVDLQLGYAQSNWTGNNTNKIMGASAVSLYSPTSNGNGGFTVGADLGYNITQHIAAELGWFYLPKVSGSTTGNAVGGTTATGTASVSSGFAYAAAKLTVPAMTDLNLFGKVGVAYRYLTYSVPSAIANLTGNPAGNGNNWSALFGAGLQYMWNSWTLGAQYTYLPGNANVNNGNTSYGAPNAVPEANLYTGFLGYKFNV